MVKIFAAILMLLLLFVMVLPVTSFSAKLMGMNCISKCCDKKQDKKQHSENKDCNPFLACSLAAWLQAPKIYFTHSAPLISKQVYFTFNDNRIMKSLSALFHPPNMVEA